MPAPNSCILKPLGKTLHFLEIILYLKFCVFQFFDNPRSMLRVEKTPIFSFLVSLNGRIYKVDITCALQKLDANASQTVCMAHDIL